MRSLLFGLLAVFALLVPSAARAELHVVASLPALAAIAAEVGFGVATVESLATSTEDPHFVDPRPSFVLALANADLLVYNGLELEAGWLDGLVTQSRNSSIRAGGHGAFNASEHVNLLEVPTGTLDRSMGDVHAGGNPHFLIDPRAAASIARALGARMAALDPYSAAEYLDNAERFATACDEAAARWRTRFGSLAPAERQVVQYHASFAYLFDWLGLSAVATVEPRPGIPPDPGHVVSVRTAMTQAGARVIVQEPFYPASTSRTLASLVSGTVYLFDVSPDFAGGATYLPWLEETAQGLYDVLSSY